MVEFDDGGPADFQRTDGRQIDQFAVKTAGLPVVVDGENSPTSTVKTGALWNVSKLETVLVDGLINPVTAGPRHPPP
jgi:hypothetical protein